MNTTHKLTTIRGIALAAILLLGKAQAATFTWDGGGTGDDWKTADNWDLNADHPGFAATSDLAVINLNGADVALSGGLANNLSNLSVTNATAGQSSALTITSGTVNVLKANGLSISIGGAGSNTLEVGAGGVLAVSGNNSSVFVGARNVAGGGVLHINGGTFTAGHTVRMVGTSTNSALRISGAATASMNGGLGIDGNQGSQNGSATDATNLLVDLTSYSDSPGEVFTLLSYGGTLTGAFTNITVTGASSPYEINYGTLSNSEITLTMIPEPSSLVLLGLAGLAAIGYRRRH